MPRSALALALAFVAVTVGSVRAACPRDPLYPAEVPFLVCPTMVVPSPCHWCPKGDQRVDATYDHASVAELAKKMVAALVRPWTIDSSTLHEGVANLVGHDAHHHLWIRIAPIARGSTMHIELSSR